VVVKILSRGCQKTVKMAIRSLSVPRLINLHVDLHFLVTEGGVDEAGVFHKIPRIDDSRLAEIFTREVLAMLVRKELLSPEWAERILSWPHSGFNVHGGRGSGRGPRLCLGIIFRRTQPRIYIAGECPGRCPGDPLPPHSPVDKDGGEWRAEGSPLAALCGPRRSRRPSGWGST